VGDAVRYDATRGLMEIEVKNRFSVGDQIDCIHPAGNQRLTIERMENAAGQALTFAPGSGHRVWVPLPAAQAGAFVARVF
jgi:U32 family peptidase